MTATHLEKKSMRCYFKAVRENDKLTAGNIQNNMNFSVDFEKKAINFKGEWYSEDSLKPKRKPHYLKHGLGFGSPKLKYPIKPKITG